MEVNGEEERRSGNEVEEKQVYYSLLNSPGSTFQKALQSILNCLGLDSASSSSSSSSSSSPSSVEEYHAGTKPVQETGMMAKIAQVLSRRPKQQFSSGEPGQKN